MTTLQVITTPGASDANAYAGLADAEAYALTCPIKGVWATSDDATKAASLVQATRLLDGLSWAGYRTHPLTQSLQWPRLYVYDREGYAISADGIPKKIMEATCEFAMRLVGDDRSADSGGLSPETVKIGSLSMGPTRRRPIPSSVLEMVRDYLGTTGATVVRS